MAGNSRSESGEAKDEIKLPISTSAAASSSSSARKQPHHLWTTMNEDLLIKILEKLDIEVTVRCGAVCKEWGKACTNPALWRVLVLDLKNFEEISKEKQRLLYLKNIEESKEKQDVLDLKNVKESEEKLEVKFELMCKCAADRSQGQLIDLSLANNGENDLLDYITDRARRLRRLKLLDYDIEGSFVIEALKKLPKLEELHRHPIAMRLKPLAPLALS